MRIGLFDSGIGGFTVLKKVIELCPNNSFIYLADTARLPYGVKTTNEIKKIAEEISAWFLYQNIDAFLVACNTTNAIALDVIKKKLNVPIFDLIESVSSTIQESRVGVLATPSTIKTKAYTKAILNFNPKTYVFEQSCPEFVPMIEKDIINSDELVEIAIRYLRPLLKQKIECLILGCSHYPLIASLLKELLPSHVRLIDPALGMAMNLDRLLGVGNSSMKNSLTFSNTRFCVTSDSSAFALKAMYWLENFPEVELISLRSKARVF